ncbi:MAG: LPXTG cell wall anchor domain-containing protein [Saccharolobus sp.]
MNKKGIFLLLPLLSLLLISSITMSSSTSQLTIKQYYSSTLKTISNHTTYEYSYTESSSSSTNEEEVTYNYYSFNVIEGSLENFSGKISVTVSPFNITVYSQIPQLARVILVEPGLIEELVWAGFLNSSGQVSGIAYFNSSATLILQYLNGTSFANVTLNISHGQYTKSITLLLHKVNLTYSREFTASFSFQYTQPERYQKMKYNFEGIESEAPYNTTILYYNNTYVPAMLWEGEGSGYVSISGNTYAQNAQFTTIEFFGINGSVLGYLTNSFTSSKGNINVAFFNVSFDSMSSYIKLVINPNAEYLKTKPQTTSMFNMNGNQVVVVISNGKIESTANVNLYHQVVVVSPSTLAYINVTNYGGYVVIFPNGTSEYVNLAKPTSMNTTNVTINGKSYYSQVVKINSNGYTVFNVSLAKNESVTVFEKTSNGMVQLNPSNYFIYNGHVIVFTDPSTTYYIVYGYTPSTGSSISIIYAIVGIIIIAIVAILIIIIRRK